MTGTFVLVDLDHTISDAFPRDAMAGKVSWDEYHAAGVDDLPFLQMVHLINGLFKLGYTIVGFTARPEKFRNQTLKWLIKHDVSMDELLMRPDNAFRPAPEIKLQLALERFGSEDAIRKNVAMIIDDRDDVVQKFRGLGVLVLQAFATSQHGEAS